MDVRAIMTDLQTEINRLQSAYDALAGISDNGGNGAKRQYIRRGPGRPPNVVAAPRAKRPKRFMSAAARKRISQAMKARWAARRA